MTTTGGNGSNKVSGKVLSKKNDTSSVDTDRNTNNNTSTSHKIDLSASLDLKNIQFKKIAVNKV